MFNVKQFFENIDFSFDKDFCQNNVIIFENAELTKKLKNNIFVYDNKNIEQTQSSFYIIATNLTEKELLDTRKYIWNEDKYDLFFYPENATTISLFYAKKSPDENALKIDTFKGQNEDNKNLEKIKKWNFESGAFWLSYANFIDKIKKSERIDEKLIKQLKILKSKLLKKLGKDKIETIQSLIDRTLFIKFLEDNHIINSFFYQHFFNDQNLNYKELLHKKDAESINLLFEKINEIFSNVLFITPTIKDEFIIKSSDLIYRAIKQEDLKTGQLSLFDFRFDIIPIEFISHIYEVFLEDDQLDQGIYYTPPKLAQLIIDDTISKTGKILDPACGSGMFLILGFRKLLENNPTPPKANVSQEITHKIDLLQKYIFGIEKENTAWRLTIFSLYLEILKGLPSDEIKEYIKKRIEQNTDIKIFPDFSDNIKEGNSLGVLEAELHFPNQTFNYIVGNPPFLQISQKATEIDFINNYKTKINGKEIKANNIIGKNQISQAFILKIKDWANENTKFGFVLNSSNFYNEKSTNFQKFFFENYRIENFYELSRVKNILFKKAKESVIVVIFNNNKIDKNTLKYYPVNLELFSETFKTLVIQEDNKIDLKQKDILEQNIILRDYLIGNKFDLKLYNKIRENNKIEHFLFHIKNTKDKIYNGIQIVGEEQLIKEFKIPENKWKTLKKKERKEYSDEFKKKYTRAKKENNFTTPLIIPKNLLSFQLNKPEIFLGDISNFHRKRNSKIYEGKKILINRVGSNLNAFYSKGKIYYNFDIYSIFLSDSKLYNLFTAILNSTTINYLTNLIYRKRSDGSYPKIGYEAIKNIPIPKELDKDLVSEISKISKQLTDRKLKYEDEIKDKLNELIYDLYDLSFTERQRIKDFFSEKKLVSPEDFEEYKQTLKNVFELYFENNPTITHYQDKSFGFDLSVVAIHFNQTENKQPTAKKTLKFIISEEILKNTKENFLVLREKIIGDNCIYITKSNKFQNWTKSKAFEDGKDILKLIKQ